MRDALYKTRPVEPHSARLGGERINDFIIMSEGNSNAYMIQTSEGNIQVNAGLFFEAKVHERNFDTFSTDPVRYQQFSLCRLNECLENFPCHRWRQQGIKIDIAADFRFESGCFRQR